MEKIKEMSIDLETYSDVDIKKSGVYKYAESENFEILLFAVSINGDDVIVYDLACGDVLPDEILDAIVIYFMCTNMTCLLCCDHTCSFFFYSSEV